MDTCAQKHDKLNLNFDLPAVTVCLSSPSLSSTSVSLPELKDVRRRCALCCCLSPIPLTPIPLSTAAEEKATEMRSQNRNVSPFSLLSPRSLPVSLCLWCGSWDGNSAQSVCCSLQTEVLTDRWNLAQTFFCLQMANPID